MSKQILLADDSAAARASVEKALGNTDYQIITAENGGTAMKQIRDAHPHLVLAHAMLPDIDGYEVCRQVKETPDTSHIPVLLLTGTFEPFDINRAKEVRYDGFVTKPLDGPELLSLVAKCIDNTVYPAADPVPAETPEPDPPVDTEAEASVVDAIPAVPPDTTAGNGSDAMLDRIFPEDPGEDDAADGETVTITEDGDDELFSLVEPEVTVTESPADEDDGPVPSSDPGSNAFGVWGGTRETAEDKPDEAEQTVVVEQTTEASTDPVADPGEQKPEGSDEGSDLSWFLRKYEEKQQSADVEAGESIPEPALMAADPFSLEADDTTPVVEELTVDTDPEPQEEEAADPGKETVEPLPLDVEDQDAAPLELDDQQLERISRRVVELLSDSVVRDVAWEAVPEIAERLIRERIREIETEAETSD